MTNDYSGFTKAPSTEQLQQLTDLVHAMREAEKDMIEKQEAADLAASRVRKLVEVDIPELMASVRLKKFTTSDGVEVAVKTHYSAAPLVINRQAAYDWLEANGHGGLVKRTIEVGFGAQQQEAASTLLEDLKGRFNNVAQERKVEPSSLKAFCKRAIEDGVEIPRDLLGVRVFDKAEVKTSK